MTYRTKIGSKHQITIPQAVYKQLGLQVGDQVGVREQNGKAVIEPLVLMPSINAPKLTKAEQTTLVRAQKKIKAINDHPINSRGLTKPEARVAAKAGLIDLDQAYWWLEPSQKEYREAEKDIKHGRVSEPFDNIDDLIHYLHN